MKFFTILFFSLTCLSLQAQNINWEKLDMDDAFGYTSTVDSQNNIIVVASGPFETQATTLFVRKYDANGNLLMQTSIGSTSLNNDGVTDHELPYQVETDSQDNIIIAGVNTIINTSTSSSCFTPPCYFPQALKVIKLAPDGQLIFNKTLAGHSNSFDQLLVDDNYLAIDDSDNIYYTGVGSITDTSNETAFGTILVKLAPDGTILFTDVEDIVGSGNSISSGLMALGQNFVAVVNSTTSNEELTAWDDNGNVLWNINLDSSIDKFRAIVVNPSTNDIYVLAEAFPPNPILTKIDSNGNILYTQTYSLGETAVTKGLGFVAPDKLAFGATSWSDAGSNSSLYTKVVNTSDGSTFSDQTQTLAQNLSRIRDFETNISNGSYYVAVNSTTNAGLPASGTLHAYNINGGEWHATNPNLRVRSVAIGQGSEVYVMTDNVWDLYQYNTTLSNQTFTELDVKMYPNPVKNELFVNSPMELDSVEIYDALGKLILLVKDIENEKPIHLSSLKTGVYFAKFKMQNGDFQTTKIIKQ